MDAAGGRFRAFAWGILLAGLVAAGCQRDTYQPGQWHEHTAGLPFVFGYDAGEQARAGDSRPVLYFVTTTWCGYCRQLGQETFRDPGVRERMEKFLCVLIDADREPRRAAALGVGGYPTLVIDLRDGQPPLHVPGFRPAAEMKDLLTSALAGLPSKEADSTSTPAKSQSP